MKLTNLIFSKFESDPYTVSISSMFGVNSLLLLGVFAAVMFVCFQMHSSKKASTRPHIVLPGVGSKFFTTL